MADLFLKVKKLDIASYADDSTPFIAEDNIKNLIALLEEVFNALFDWFKNNGLKGNYYKCHALLSTNKHLGIGVGGCMVGDNECQKLLGVERNVNLYFNNQISDFCKNVSRKISALARAAPFMRFDKRKLLINVFFMSHFSYSPLIWMSYSRINNKKINMLHGKCLRIICKDKQSSFNKFLNKESSVSLHIRNIQRLAIEML